MDFVKKYRLRLAVAGIFALLVLAIVVSLFALSFVLSSQPDKQSYVTAKDLETLTTGTTFTDARNNEFVYQSPVFDFEIRVDTATADLIENNSGIYISPRYIRGSSINYSMNLYVSTPFSGKTYELSKEIESEKSYYQRIADEVTEILSEEDLQIDGREAHKFVVKSKAYDGTDRFEIIVLNVYNNRLYRWRYSESDKELTGTEIDQYLQSVKWIDSNALELTAEYQSNVWGYSFSYDRKLWKLDNLGAQTLNLTRRNDITNLDADMADADVNIFSDEIRRLDLVGSESNYINKLVADRIESLQSIYTEKGLALEETESLVKFGKEVKLIKYQLDPKLTFGKKFNEEYLLINNNAYIRITVSHTGAEDQPYKDAQAILDTLKFITPTSGQVKGASSFGKVEEQIALRVKPAVAKIYHLRCGSVAFPVNAKLVNLSAKTYKLCSGSFGSGFFVNKDGIVATNGHIAVFDDLQVAFDSAYYGYSVDLVVDLYKDILINNTDPTATFDANSISDQEIYNYLADNPDKRLELAKAVTVLLKDVDLNMDSEIYVQKAGKPFDLDQDLVLVNKSQHYKATVLDYNYDATNTDSTKSDVALLDLNEPGDYPVMSLGDISSVNVGQSILILGYPGVANDATLVSEQSRGEQTVTRGIVSAFKETGGDRTLIQTDASFQHGSSGGPAVNYDSSVIGIATYGLSESGAADYSFLREVSDLKELMQKNNIENALGETEQAWREGLDLFWNSHFSESIRKLNEAKLSYPYLVEADRFIALAQTKVDSGLDIPVGQTGIGEDQPLVGGLTSIQVVIIVVVCVLLCVIGLFSLILLRLLFGSKKQFVYHNQPLALQPESVSQTPVQGMPAAVETQVQIPAVEIPAEPSVIKESIQQQIQENQVIQKQTSNPQIGSQPVATPVPVNAVEGGMNETNPQETSQSIPPGVNQVM